MRYILNSAVITAPGNYTYEHATITQAQGWLTRGGIDGKKWDWESCIGYPETAEALQAITMIKIPVNRKTITMQIGDEALVFRLVFPQGYRPDPSQKGNMGIDFILAHCEIGILRRCK